MKLLFMCLLVLVTRETDCVILTRCKLAKKIIDARVFENTFLGSWICLIEKESKRDTQLLVQKPHNRNYYGLFQIPQKFCSSGRKGGDCHVACEELLAANDLTASCRCAQHIWRSEGFKFWRRWQLHCDPVAVRRITDEIYKCPELQKQPLGRSVSRDEPKDFNIKQ